MDSLLHRLGRIEQETPDNVAVIHGAESITYNTLVNLIRNTCKRLARSTQPGSRAVIAIENSIDYVVALYGCWSAGLIAVPIDANSRPQEIEQVVRHAVPTVIVSLARRRNARVVADSLGIRFFDIQTEMDSAPSQSRLDRLESEDALIIYTSGTSGNPKGVVLTHRNLVTNTESIIEYLRLTRDDSALVVLPFHYSYGNSILHTHLYVGGTLVIGSSMMYPQQVTNELREYDVTGFSGVPTTMSLLVSRTDLAADPPRLRYVTQAGGGMSKELTKQLRASLGNTTELFVMYGQTEATARLTWLPPHRLEEKLGSAGTSIPGVEIRIESESGVIASAGEVGEIQARGGNIMSRYWQNPVATSEAIVDGWLHTGDLGFLDPDGFLYIQGRASEMIKTGAYRISPTEIEELISELEIVDEVAVCGVRDKLLGEVVAAFLVGQKSAKNTKEVLSYCRKSLSLHKVPRHVHWIESLPKTASGKLRKHLLAAEYDKAS